MNTSSGEAPLSDAHGDCTATVLGLPGQQALFHPCFLLHCGQQKSLDGFMGKFYCMFKEHILPTLHT